MKKVSSRKTDWRPTRPASLTGMIVIFLLAAATFVGPFLLAAKDKRDGEGKTPESSRVLKGLPAGGLSEDEAILQALNRLGFWAATGEYRARQRNGAAKMGRSATSSGLDS
jgi:hypothetical protein